MHNTPCMVSMVYDWHFSLQVAIKPWCRHYVHLAQLDVKHLSALPVAVLDNKMWQTEVTLLLCCSDSLNKAQISYCTHHLGQYTASMLLHNILCIWNIARVHAITNTELTCHGGLTRVEELVYSCSCPDKPSVVHFHSIWSSGICLQKLHRLSVIYSGHTTWILPT